MPANTTVEEQIALINRLHCIQRAMRAEFKLSRLRKRAKVKSVPDPIFLGLNKNIQGQ